MTALDHSAETARRPREARRPARPGGAGRRAERRRAAVGFSMALPPVLVISLFVGLPVVLAVAFSLGVTGGLNRTAAVIGQDVHSADGLLTTAAYEQLFADPRFPRDLAATVLVTVVTTLVVLGLATGIAVLLRLRGGWAATLLSGLAVVPLFIPVVIASWAILTFYSADGFLRSLFAQVGLQAPVLGFTVTGVIIASVWVNLPFALLMAASGMQAIPDALIDAARDAGAGTLRIVTRVLVPLAGIPLVIAGTFTAIGVLGQFTVPYFTGPNAPQQLGVDISKYFQSFNQPQQAAAIAVVVFVIASGVAATYVWANFRSAKQEGRV
ncbi:MAG TPA: ABC transporter permease subunit [Actinotalea caeni]|uniref:ABC transporter permease n=1 Tax=Actinotalea caeni TaxID=1348467 RepID=UPI002B4B810A|nr:ABC transporter permease subunit [Actinotalea caeni]HLV56386.1 ABC transporter permease subunit [Actinotalea caeni]